MSWAKVFKINSNLSKPLNTLMSELISGVTTLLNTINTNVTNTKTQVGNVNTAVGNVNTTVGNVNTKLTQMSTQMRDSKVVPMRIITASTTYTPEKTGTYRVICVGKGGDGYVSTSSNYHPEAGSGGGVAIKDIRLVKSQSYNITVSGTSSFSTLLTATAGGDRGGTGGTGTGGDYNYTGEIGEEIENYTAEIPARAGAVGVAIVGLTQFLSSSVSFTDAVSFELRQGGGLLGYGGGGSGVCHNIGGSTDSANRKGFAQSGQPAAVIIIPLELEE